MLCVRCVRSIFAVPLRPSSSSSSSSTSLARTVKTPLITSQSRRPLSLLSRIPTRPILPRSTHSPTVGSTQPILSDAPSSTFQPAQPPLSISVRGAIRDTFNPSHRVRKRRHGFLSRIKQRNGRKTLARRRAKGRRFLSH